MLCKTIPCVKDHPLCCGRPSLVLRKTIPCDEKDRPLCCGRSSLALWKIIPCVWKTIPCVVECHPLCCGGPSLGCGRHSLVLWKTNPCVVEDHPCAVEHHPLCYGRLSHLLCCIYYTRSRRKSDNPCNHFICPCSKCSHTPPHLSNYL